MIHVIDNAAPTAILDLIRTIAENKETWHFKRPIAENVTFKDKRPRLDIVVGGQTNDNFLAGLAIGALMSAHDRGGYVHFHPDILHCGISMKDSAREDITHHEHIDEHEHDHHHDHHMSRHQQNLHTSIDNYCQIILSKKDHIFASQSQSQAS